MTADRRFPAETAGPFPAPPRTFDDREDREITLRPYDGTDREYEALVGMYADFDASDRAQGVPPVKESGVRRWLDTLLGDRNGDDERDTHNVLAWHGERAVGHATLVPDDQSGYELAIFVHQEYQSAGIGSELIRALLGHGAREGVEHVWLTVERWNSPAVALYEGVGFETTDAESFELEMALRLA